MTAICFLTLLAGQTHDLRLTPQNVHWRYYDARLAPVLRISSGDAVRIEP